jgi:hypothetical protein
MNNAIKTIIGSPSDFGIGWIILLVAAAITIILPCLKIINLLVKKLLRKSEHLKKISLLDTSTHISYFISILGVPIHIGTLKDPDGKMYHEHIFVNHFFYVQAVTDVAGVVALFSVTTRRKKFNPILKTQFSDFVVQLGKSRFTDISIKQSENARTKGDHGAITYYSETHYLGFDGWYRDFGFTYNPNGYGKLAIATDDDNPQNLSRFRETTINTYTIISDKNLPCDYFGPKAYQIRVFQNH